MKSLITVIVCVLGSTLVASSAHAQSTRAFDQPITNVQQAAAVPKGAKVAMACSKCKTIQVADRKSLQKSEEPCPGCHGHFGFDSYGHHSSHGHYVHDCTVCGPSSVFCCTTKTGK